MLATSSQSQDPKPAPERPHMRVHRPLLSIRVIVTSVAVAITAAAVIGVGAVAERNTRTLLETETQARLLVEARSLSRSAANAFMSEFPELALQPMVRDLGARRPELTLISVVGRDGSIQGHPEARLLGTTFRQPAISDTTARVDLFAGERLGTEPDRIVAAVPIAAPGGQVIGTTWLGLERQYVTALVAEARRESALVFGFALLVGVGLTFLIMTWLLRPITALRDGLERIGRGDLDTPVRMDDRTEFGMLADTMNRMSAELKRAQASMVEKERLAHELELAREIQGSLLPTNRTIIGEFLISGTQRVAAEVGGDYFDFFPLSRGRIGIAVADVAGKGLAGCMVMSMLSALLRAFKDNQDSPAELLAILDDRLSHTLRPGTFITMFYGILDPREQTLTFASAGHSPTLVYRHATADIETIPSTGIPVGAIRGGTIRESLRDETIGFGPKDLVVQYTDGVNEAFAGQGEEQFGFERVEESVMRLAEQGCETVLEGLRTELDKWRGDANRHDDETILVVSRELVDGARIPDRSEDPSEAMALVPDPSGGRGRVEEAPRQDALEHLREARERGSHLEIPASLVSLAALKPWLDDQDAFRELETSRYSVLATALYEACANVIEHGYGGNDRESLELWWVPRNGKPMTGNAIGYFLIRDHARPFTGEGWTATDFDDPSVWKRGRGLGMDIIHRTMVHVTYGAATPEGNLTLLVFDPREIHNHTEGRKHA